MSDDLSSVSVLAANASMSLGLVARGVYDPIVQRGIEQGREFCEILQTGEKARNDAEHFSAHTIAADELFSLVILLPDGKQIASRVSEVSEKLEKLIAELSEGHPPSSPTVEDLKDYFFKLSASLPYYEEIQRRLSTQAR